MCVERAVSICRENNAGDGIIEIIGVILGGERRIISEMRQLNWGALRSKVSLWSHKSECENVE